MDIQLRCKNIFYYQALLVKQFPLKTKNHPKRDGFLS